MNLFFTSCLIILLTISCKKHSELVNFSTENELLLGDRLSEVIANDSNYELISPETHPISYSYLQSRVSDVINSDQLIHKDDFAWSISIIDEDDIRSAFITPGGHIYIYSGMLFYLINEDQLMGLISHLMAHADQGHITDQLLLEFGPNNLLSITMSGDDASILSIIEKIDARTNQLPQSRQDEMEADQFSIMSLAETDHACNSVHHFFERINSVQPTQQETFISLHSHFVDRKVKIEDKVNELTCNTSVDSGSVSRYQSFRNSLQ